MSYAVTGDPPVPSWCIAAGRRLAQGVISIQTGSYQPSPASLTDGTRPSWSRPARASSTGQRSIPAGVLPGWCRDAAGLVTV
jgi:hypothetical protein